MQNGPVRALAILLLAARALVAEPPDGPGRASVATPAEALARLGAVTVLDAREAKAFRKGHLPGALRVDWRDFTAQRPGAVTLLFGDSSRWGRLAEPGPPLEARLRALGLGNDRPVLVVGDPAGWGEEGRIAWSLLYWGAGEVLLLDGGFPGWAADPSRPVEAGEPPAAPGGDFVVRVRPARRIEKAGLLARVRAGALALLDAREPEEFGGKRLHGQRRGGHLPGARLVPFRSLFRPDGRYVEAETLAALAGPLDPAAPPVTYCTGGVRSGLLTVLLEARLGVRAVNYDGSLWEWSADASLPLVSPGSR